MNSQELLAKILKRGQRIGEVAGQITISESLGFAIPLPNNATEENVADVSAELLKLRWSFEILKMRGENYIVLFPFG